MAARDRLVSLQEARGIIDPRTPPEIPLMSIWRAAKAIGALTTNPATDLKSIPLSVAKTMRDRWRRTGYLKEQTRALPFAQSDDAPSAA